MQGQRQEVDLYGSLTNPISRVSTSSFHSGNTDLKELAMKVRFIEQQLEVFPKVWQQFKTYEQKIHQLEEDNHLFRQISQKLLDEFYAIKQKVNEEQKSAQKSLQSLNIDLNLLNQQQQIQTVDIVESRVKMLKDEFTQQQNQFMKQIENNFLLYQMSLRRKTSNSPKLVEKSKTPTQINQEQRVIPFVQKFIQNPNNISSQSSLMQNNQKDSTIKSDQSQYLHNSHSHLVNLTQIQSRPTQQDRRQNFDNVHNFQQKLASQMKLGKELSSQQHYLNVDIASNTQNFQRNLSGSPTQRFSNEALKSENKSNTKNKKDAFQLDLCKVKQLQPGTASSRF